MKANKVLLVVASILLFTSVTFSQGIGINTPTADVSSVLDVVANDRGVLLPRMTTAQRNAIPNPATGLLIYNTDTDCFNYWEGSMWVDVCGTVCNPPATPGSVNGATSVSNNQTGVSYSISAVGGATSYTWTVPSGAIIASGQGTTSVSVNFATSSGNVCVTADNSCGSSSTSCIAVTVSNSTFKRVFVTDAVIPNANLGGLSGADNLCQSKANNMSLGGTWKAWLSSTGVSVASRFNQNNGEYRLLNGTVIATTWADLTDGSIAAPISLTELGNTVSSGVLTNTKPDGSSDNTYTDCSGWTNGTACSSPGGASTGGVANQSNQCWTGVGTSCASMCCVNSSWRLYCFEQ